MANNYVSDGLVSFQSVQERLPGSGTDLLGDFERSLRQQNLKFLEGELKGEHHFYDPRNLRSGAKLPNFDPSSLG